MPNARSALAHACIVVAILGLACERGGPRTRAPSPSTAAAPELDAVWMQAFLVRFADDTMAGRYTLDPTSIGRAAQMIEDEYAALGIGPIGDGYRVPFDFEYGSERLRAHHVWIEAGGPAQAIAAEQLTTLSTAGDTAVVAEAVVVGHGTARARKPARPRVAIALDHASGSTAALSAAALDELIAHEQAAGSKALVLIGGDVATAALAREREVVADARGIPVVVLGEAAANGLLASAGLDLAGLRKLAAKGPLARPLPGVRISMAPRSKPKIEHAANVLAWIPGRDHPEQIVLVGAHYDHIGTTARGQFCRGGAEGDTVCNGADDNGSGTAMVLAIARAIATAERGPSRSIVFAHFAAEELGLHGSEALAEAPPHAKPFMGGEIVAMVNFDMVGRLGKDGLSVGGIGSSDGWMPLLDRIGTRDIPTIYERTVSARSDHASFYELGIPVLFFFTGLHDDYHRAGDELAKINEAGMASIGAIALELVVALGDGEKLRYTAPGSGEGLVGRMPGSDERTVEKRVGVDAK